MTWDETVAHRRSRARHSFESAALLDQAGKYALVLFHCQFAVEKAFKAAYVAEQDAAPPHAQPTGTD